MSNPIQQLQAILPQRSAALLAAPVNRRYLTGFASSAGVLFCTRETALFLTDSRYIDAAKASITACPVEELTRLSRQLRALCSQHRIKRLFLETAHTTLAQAAQYRSWLPGVWLERSDALDRRLRELRMHKSPREAAAIRRAQGIAEQALAQLKEQLRPGITERELALALDYAMLQAGAEAISFDTIAVAGEHGALPHGVPGHRTLQQGDLLTLDFGAVAEGYHSDMTRTFALGELNDTQRRIYETVLEAQAAALAAVGPGVPCNAVDAAARNVIKAAGYGAYFRHGTGHGVGLEIHEAPSLSPRSTDRLAPGMVVTVEPGIYLPGTCGVRIEDMVLVTESGYENLTHYSKSPTP